MDVFPVVLGTEAETVVLGTEAEAVVLGTEAEAEAVVLGTEAEAELWELRLLEVEVEAGPEASFSEEIKDLYYTPAPSNLSSSPIDREFVGTLYPQVG